ncbi:hypothetical protein L2E82_45464 [Cichorium intybus]|uniref:Uncharacterized protein n=1 Tax=Cichorium intybus TaxID=13427 RepID=A0ACB8ZXF7_CICIN|nr:hypothetical protein L2E82_45464 [Cichorium intybus]
MLILSPLCDLERIQAQGYTKLDNYFATGGTIPVVSSDLPIILAKIHTFEVPVRRAHCAWNLGAPRLEPGRTAPGAWAGFQTSRDLALFQPEKMMNSRCSYLKCLKTSIPTSISCKIFQNSFSPLVLSSSLSILPLISGE